MKLYYWKDITVRDKRYIVTLLLDKDIIVSLTNYA